MKFKVGPEEQIWDTDKGDFWFKVEGGEIAFYRNRFKGMNEEELKCETCGKLVSELPYYFAFRQSIHYSPVRYCRRHLPYGIKRFMNRER